MSRRQHRCLCSNDGYNHSEETNVNSPYLWMTFLIFDCANDVHETVVSLSVFVAVLCH